MPELTPEETFKNWIISFHKLRIQGFMTEKESKSIWKKILECISRSGYTVKDIGFYDWEFVKKKDKED